MTKKLYIPVEARRAVEQALKNLTAQYAKKAEYVPFEGGKAVRRRAKGFHAYFAANLK